MTPRQKEIVDLRPYIWRPHRDSDWALLVFANNRTEAKAVGFRARYGDDCYTDCRVSRLKMTEWIMDQAESDVPHVIVSPKGCPTCEMWSDSPDCCTLSPDHQTADHLTSKGGSTDLTEQDDE